MSYKVINGINLIISWFVSNNVKNINLIFKHLTWHEKNEKHANELHYLLARIGLCPLFEFLIKMIFYNVKNINLLFNYLMWQDKNE